MEKEFRNQPQNEEPPWATEIRKFKNQKRADFDPKTMTIYPTGSEGHLKAVKLEESLERTKEVGSESELAKQVKNVIKTIEKVELDPVYKNKPEQIKLLAERKEIARTMILDVLEKTREYIQSIRELDETKLSKETMGEEKFMAKIIDSDQNRKNKHNALINSMTTAIRFISHTFGNISEKAIENWEEHYLERGQSLVEVKRVDLPSKVFLPDNFTLKDLKVNHSQGRRQITLWALQIYNELSNLEQEISKKK